jgi:hypothetical protein
VIALENDGQPYPPNVIARLEVFAQNVERYQCRSRERDGRTAEATLSRVMTADARRSPPPAGTLAGAGLGDAVDLALRGCRGSAGWRARWLRRRASSMRW